MANKTIADRICQAKDTGREAKFYSTDSTSSGTEYEFTPNGLKSYMDTQIQILPSYTVATLPSAATYARGLIYVSDGTTNKRLAVSDGTNWRFPDGNIVS